MKIQFLKGLLEKLLRIFREARTSLTYERIGETNSIEISESSLITIVHFSSPEAKIIKIRNACLLDRKILYSSTSESRLPTPSMYKNWEGNQKPHLVLQAVRDFPRNVPKNTNNLLIFDTWGTSSYYHLLVDHIIPLWITAMWAEQEFNLKMPNNEYLRISENNYPTELNSTQDIFKHFFGKSFMNNASGIFNEIIYGYLFPYRPYHGPQSNENLYRNYSVWLQKFRSQFCLLVDKSNLSTNQIIVPLRESRNFDYVDRFVHKYSHVINFRPINFATLSIEDQIKVCGCAKGIFGCEGAAFANIVFMRDDSLVIPVTSEPDRLKFHERLARYIGHRFAPVILNQENLPNVTDGHLLQLMLSNKSQQLIIKEAT